MADAMLSQINLLARTAVLLLPHLYGPNGAKDTSGPGGVVDPSIPPALLQALTRLETASVDAGMLAKDQSVNSVEIQTSNDLQALCQTASQDVDLVANSVLAGMADQALAFDDWRSKTQAIEQDARFFTAGSDHPPVTVLQPPPADTAEQFLVTNLSTGVAQWISGTAYTGPVAGVTHAFAAIGADNLNIQATMPNNFIQTGAGDDSISVAMVGAGQGTNVLDGGGGSNFLVGTRYSATDLFYLDASGLKASVASTIVNFHGGDQAVLWGVNATDFRMAMADDEGAPGFTGLTIGFTDASGHTANLTIAGYAVADLSNGHLGLSFGRTEAAQGSAGRDYMMITANAGVFPAVVP